MHHHDGQRRQKLHRVIAVGDRVHAVAGRPVEPEQAGGVGAVQRIGRAREGPGAERAEVQALLHVGKARAVPAEHLKIGAEMVRQGCRLRFLQVREARHEGVFVLFHQPQEDLQQLPELPVDRPDFIAHIQLHVQRHLVVAAAAGMQFFAGLPHARGQVGFHKAVDVLVFLRDFQLPALHVGKDAVQPAKNLVALLLREDFLLRQHPHMGPAPLDVLLQQAPVEPDGCVEPIRQPVRFFCEPAAPKLCHFLKTRFPFVFKILLSVS